VRRLFAYSFLVDQKGGDKMGSYTLSYTIYQSEWHDLCDIMFMPMTLTIRESAEALKLRKQHCPVHLRPRVKMLQLLLEDSWCSNQVLADKTGAGLRTIARWVKIYANDGIDKLLQENRGGARNSCFTQEELQAIQERLADPKDCFTSYVQATDWINASFGTDHCYSTVNQLLKRRFGTKLKVGRKSHVKKDEAAAAVFKKPIWAD
jgi:transposase